MKQHEYVTDALYFPETKPSYTKGEMVKKVFENIDELEKEIKRRARCVLGIRGLKNPERIRLNMTSTNHIRGLEFTEERLAEIACEVAGDTQFWGIEYF